MGRSKPRTNKRPPPKPKVSSAATSRPSSGVPSDVAEDMFASFPGALASPGLASAMGLGAMGVNASLDPTDPNFPSAFQSWSTSALSQLGQLPSLTPSQLSVIAGAAAGVVDAGLRANGHTPPLGAGNGAQPNVSMLPNLPPSGQGLPIDLPASLAALFEAKLTLDREKAKLMRMQKELKGYREGVAAVNLKGKQVAVQDPEDLGECTCGRNGHAHEYPGSAHSGSDEYYYYDTEDEECCDCCSHDHEHDHEHVHEHVHDHDHAHVHDDAGYDDCHHHHHHLEHDHGHHDHEHTHTHEGEVDSDPDEYERHAAHADALERQRLERHAERLRHAQHAQLDRAERERLQHDAYAAAMSVAERVAFEKHNLAQAQAQAQQLAQEQNQQSQQAGERGSEDAKGDGRGRAGGGGGGRKRLVDDPERMDEAVRELFNWIKAVVWTIEQAAIVAGRRGWAAEAK